MRDNVHAIHDRKIPKCNTKSAGSTSHTTSVRLSDDELRIINEAAEKRGVSRSAYIRQRVLEGNSPEIIVSEGTEILHLLAKTYNEMQEITHILGKKTANSAEISELLCAVLKKQHEVMNGYSELTDKITFAFNTIDYLADRLKNPREDECEDTVYLEDEESYGGYEYGNSKGYKSSQV